MTHLTATRAVAGLAAIASIALTGQAVAGDDKERSPAGPPPAASVVPASDFRPVSSDIDILDEAGTVLERRSCFWTVPEDDDKPCLAFASDPQVAFEAIERAGGSSATVHVVSEPIGLDALTRITRRSNGTWLFRTRGTSSGRALHNGRVCTADGQRCERFDAEGAKASSRSARAAAAKLRRKKR